MINHPFAPILGVDPIFYIDLETRSLQPLDNPFGPRVSPMS